MERAKIRKGIADKDKTSEELLAELLRDATISDDAKNRISLMAAKWRAELEKQKSVNESLNQIIAQDGSFFLPRELDTMILQRTNAENLQNVSRVKRTWRSYIAKNRLEMKSFVVEYVKFAIPNRNPFSFLKLEDSEPQDNRETRERRLSFSDLLSYRPQSLIFVWPKRDLFEETLYDSQVESVESMPQYWFDRIKKVECHLSGSYDEEDYSRSFVINRFEHLSELCVEIYRNRARVGYLTDFIEESARADALTIRVKPGVNLILVDDVLEAVLRKSLVHPVGFPTTVGNSRFSIEKIIRFIEVNPFIKGKTHQIYIFSPVLGTEVEWNNWLERNATLMTFFHLNTFNENPKEKKYAIEKVSYRRWKFAFGEVYLDVIIDSFVATPASSAAALI